MSPNHTDVHVDVELGNRYANRILRQASVETSTCQLRRATAAPNAISSLRPERAQRRWS
jgi:hypothetical protein